TQAQRFVSKRQDASGQYTDASWLSHSRRHDAWFTSVYFDREKRPSTTGRIVTFWWLTPAGNCSGGTMMRIKWLLLVCSLAATAAQAESADLKNNGKSTWIDPGWRQTVDRCAVIFDEQGLSITTCDFELTALDRRGVGAISQQ